MSGLVLPKDHRRHVPSYADVALPRPRRTKPPSLAERPLTTMEQLRAIQSAAEASSERFKTPFPLSTDEIVRRMMNADFAEPAASTAEPPAEPPAAPPDRRYVPYMAVMCLHAANVLACAALYLSGRASEVSAKTASCAVYWALFWLLPVHPRYAETVQFAALGLMILMLLL